MRTNEMGDLERSIWISWCTFVAISSLVGDSIILVATNKYQAIKLHKTIVAVIQHMAVNDLVLTVVRVLPTVVALTANGWFLGKICCNVQQCVEEWCFHYSLVLTALLTSMKLLNVKFPLRTVAFSSILGHKICLMSALFLTVVIAVPANIIKCYYSTIFFDEEVFICIASYQPGIPPTYVFFCTHTIAILSLLVVVVTSLLLLLTAVRSATQHGDSVRWQGVAPVLATAAVLSLAYLPSLVSLIVHEAGGVYSPTGQRITNFLFDVNIVANFFVYSLTMASFRGFLKTKISELVYSRSKRRVQASSKSPCGTLQRQGTLKSTIGMHMQELDIIKQ